ncbi:MAG: fibronectin type III domain-containing protein [Sulfolobus sp.]|nr:fibronectin type III domain-containing protein [Sulfolobus sp.]
MRKRLLVILLVSSIIGLSFSVTPSAYYTVYVNLDSEGKLPQPIYAAGAVYFNGSIYLIGGEGNNGILNTVYVYHNGTWQRGPQLPFALAFPSVVVCDGTIFVIGGQNSSGISPYVLKLVNGSWQVVSRSMPVPVYAAAAFSYGGKIYVIGGFNGTGSALYYPPSNKVQVFDPKTNTWSVIGESPVPFAGAEYYFNGSALFVTGGYIGYSSFGFETLLYYPETNKWVELPNAPVSASYGSVAFVNGVYVVVGGYMLHQGSVMPGAILIFNGNNWTVSQQQEQYPTSFAPSVQIGSKLVIIGGLGSQNLPSDKVQVYSFHFPPLVPVISSIKPIPYGFTISWTDVNATGYIIYVYQNGTLVTTYTVGNVTSATVTGLENGVTYQVTIQAFNSYGFSPMSVPVEVTPQVAPLQPIVKVKVGDRNATITWSVPSNGAEVLGYYVILVSQTGVVQTLNLPSSYSSYTFTGLEPKVRYYVEVLAYNQAGNSTPGSAYFYVLAPPSINFTSVVKTPNYFTISWNATYPANFTVYVYKGNELLLEKYVGQNTSFTYQAPFGIYNVTVMAVNPAGHAVSSVKVVYYLQPSPPNVSVEVTPRGLVFHVSSEYAMNYSVYYNGVELGSSDNGTILIRQPILSGAEEYYVVASNPGGSSITKVNLTVLQSSYTVTVKTYQGLAFVPERFSLPQVGAWAFLGILILLGIAIGYVAATRS